MKRQSKPAKKDRTPQKIKLKLAPVEVRASDQSQTTPIVGIGASAGGLEALELFLQNLPEHKGISFVVVQHMDPTRDGTLVELLQRNSPIPVTQVQDRQKVEPGHVYIIPPNKELSILHGVLHLLPLRAPRGLNLPIDYFFRSLAEDQQERSMGVILSGMGSDGTLGLRAIKEKAGATFVQALSSAKFDGMPRSAIEAGLADVVAPAEELPEKIASYLQHASRLVRPETQLEEKTLSALEKVFILLRSKTGNDFSFYKKNTIHRRIDRRMVLHQIDKIENYVRYLQESPKEVEQLFKELLIGVTNFFRDPATWEQLRSEILPRMLEEHPGGSLLRAWVPGCSTGEEAYSLAIIFKEALEQLKPPRNISLQIFATDLDREAIESARAGVYPDSIIADVSPERLSRFFLKEERGYRMSKVIREMVIFAPQNVIMDPPFTRLDILCCRNLLIYLAPEIQKKLIPLFHYSLNPGGILLLGSAETAGSFSTLFYAPNGKTRLYRRLESSVGTPPVEFPSSLVSSPYAKMHSTSLKPPVNLQVLADRVLVQRFSPVGILVNEKGDILYTSGRTGKYLEPAIGKANWNIFAMARDGLRYELSGAFSAALRGDGAVTVRSIRVGINGSSELIDLTIEKLEEPEGLRGTVMIVIAEAQNQETKQPNKLRPAANQMRMVELEKELHRSLEETQTTREEMQTSQEELKSINEELQSTNEELQSSNEELTTSKEEMQSLNEELQTVNHELQSKVEELSRSNNDMKNLLNSTDIATLFLDDDLRVRRFTIQTTKLIKLIPSDAGRPITDITTELEYPELAADSREVLRTLVFKEKLVPTRDSRWFTVRILPYRTVENVIDGVVLTFTDATAAKAVENTLREQANQLRQMTEALASLSWGCRPDGSCDYLSPQWLSYTGVPAEEQLGYGWLEQIHPEEREQIRVEWRAAAKSGTNFDAELRLRGRDGGYRWFKVRAVPIHDANGKLVKWHGANTDINDLKMASEIKRQATSQMESILEGSSDAYLTLSKEQKITGLNSAAQRMLKRSRDQVVGKRFIEVFPTSKSSLLEEKISQALQERKPATFSQNAYQFRLHPFEGGLSIFIVPNGGEDEE